MCCWCGRFRQCCIVQRYWIGMRFQIGRYRFWWDRYIVCIFHLCSAGRDMLCCCSLCEDVRLFGVRSERHGDVVIDGIVLAC